MKLSFAAWIACAGAGDDAGEVLPHRSAERVLREDPCGRGGLFSACFDHPFAIDHVKGTVEEVIGGYRSLTFVSAKDGTCLGRGSPDFDNSGSKDIPLVWLLSVLPSAGSHHQASTCSSNRSHPFRP